MSQHVLVTGAAGQIGARLIRRLVANRSVVVGVSRAANEGRAADTISGDLSDPSVVRRSVVAARERVAEHGGTLTVVHLAGLSSNIPSGLSRSSFYQQNVKITEEILRRAVEFGVDRFIFSSTGLVYGTNNLISTSEDSPLNPESLYAETKLEAEALVRKYVNENSIHGDILRLSNVYGPTSPTNTVVGRIFNQFRNNEPIDVKSRRPVRDFIHIDDVIDAILTLVKSAPSGGANTYNLSTGVGVSIGFLADLVKRFRGDVSVVYRDYGQIEDRLVLDNEKLKSSTGWRPKYDLLTGLEACLCTTQSEHESK